MNGLHLAFMRRKSGMTQAQLAAKLGSTQATIARWEMNIHKPTNVEALAAALGHRVEYRTLGSGKTQTRFVPLGACDE